MFVYVTEYLTGNLCNIAEHIPDKKRYVASNENKKAIITDLNPKDLKFEETGNLSKDSYFKTHYEIIEGIVNGKIRRIESKEELRRIFK